MAKLKNKNLLLGIIAGIITILATLLTIYFLSNNKVLAEEVSGTYDGVDWRITEQGELIIGKAGQTQTFVNRENRINNSYPWNPYREQLTSAKFVGTVKGQGSMQEMFYNCSSLTSLDVSNFDTSNVTNMSGMFSRCNNLTSLDVSNFDTSNVTTMQGMFAFCTSLTNLDLSNFDTSNVFSLGRMFAGCTNLTSINLSNFDTSNVTDMEGMFSGCHQLASLDVSNFDTSNVTRMRAMFSACRSLTSLDVSNFDTSNVKGMDGMFGGCISLTNLDLSNFDISSVVEMQEMFRGCTNLTSLDISNFDTSNVITIGGIMDGLFAETPKLEEISVGTKTNLSNSGHTTDSWSKTLLSKDAVEGISNINSAGTWYKKAAESCLE